MKVIGAPALEGLDGLGQLTTVGEHILLLRNPSLATVDGLAGVRRIERKLSIEDNVSLVDIRGLSTVQYVGESLTVYGNESLCQSAVDALVSQARAANPGLEVETRGNDDC